MNNLIGIIISYIFIGIIIIMAKFFERKGKEVSRKFIHIMLSNWWFIAMWFFDNLIAVSIVPLSFVFINYISYKKNLISAMEREDINKDGLGTVYYALSLFMLSIFTFGIIKKPEIGLYATLIMGYGDGLAAVIGKKVNSISYKVGKTYKTLAGSCTMLFITFFIIAIGLYSMQSSLWILKSLLISIIITLLEAISIKGLDNITVPISTCLLLIVML